MSLNCFRQELKTFYFHRAYLHHQVTVFRYKNMQNLQTELTYLLTYDTISDNSVKLTPFL